MTLRDKLIEYVFNSENKKFIEPEGFVYHYTNQSAYNLISRSGYLILNSHHNLNTKDSSNRELHIATNLIRDQLMEDKVLNKYLIDFNCFIEKGIVFYTSSFTRERSSHIKDKYGEYCLKFDCEILKNYQKTNSSIIFFNVEYDPIKQKQIIFDLFNLYHKFIHTNNYNEKEALIDLFEILAWIMPLFKEELHSRDKESRIVGAEIFKPKLLTPFLIKRVNFDFKAIQIYKY